MEVEEDPMEVQKESVFEISRRMDQFIGYFLHLIFLPKKKSNVKP